MSKGPSLQWELALAAAYVGCGALVLMLTGTELIEPAAAARLDGLAGLDALTGSLDAVDGLHSFSGLTAGFTHPALIAVGQPGLFALGLLIHLKRGRHSLIEHYLRVVVVANVIAATVLVLRTSLTHESPGIAGTVGSWLGRQSADAALTPWGMLYLFLCALATALALLGLFWATRPPRRAPAEGHAGGVR